MEITGAELFVKALKKESVTTLFAYPGGQAIDLFNALYGEKDIDVILPRHEQGLIHAADGYARSTGKVGVCLVTSGPGAANLVTGIATADYDSVPLVCFTGQVPVKLLGKRTFQEVNIVEITKSICKYAVAVQKREDLAETVKKAFYTARTGKPGVVVVDLPKDIQRAYGSDFYPEEITAGIFGSEKITDRDFEQNTPVYKEQLNKALELLNHARKPVFLIGGGVNIVHANREMTKLAERTGVPVVTTIMGKGAVPTANSLYIGNIGIHGSYAANMAVSKCDVLFSIGTRFNDRITGRTEEFAPNAKIIRYRRSCGNDCNKPGHHCPEYTPDFIRLAESYGAKGLRITRAEDIESALLIAKQNTKTPTVIECIIDREINVMPIVPPENALDDMILES